MSTETSFFESVKSSLYHSNFCFFLQRHHILPQSQPPPLSQHSGPPPASHLPTPHFGTNGQQGAYVPPFTGQGGHNTTKAPQNFTGYPVFMPHHFSPHYNMHMINQQSIHRPGIQMIRGQSSIYHQPPPMMHPMQIPITDPSQFTAPPPMSLIPDPSHLHIHPIQGQDDVSVQKDMIHVPHSMDQLPQANISEIATTEHTRVIVIPNHVRVHTEKEFHNYETQTFSAFKVDHENGNGAVEFESVGVVNHHCPQLPIQQDEFSPSDSRKSDTEKTPPVTLQKEVTLQLSKISTLYHQILKDM